jgi:SAM-dependent methyltransferase
MTAGEHSARAIWDRIFSDQDKASKTGGRYFYKLALERIRPGETICDVGCGYTFYLHDLMKKCGPRGSFIGIDFSSAALAKSAELANGYPNSRLVLADMLCLPMPDESVDRVFCAETLPYLLGEVETALQELARVSKQEVIFSLHTRGTYEIKGTQIEFRGNVVIEHKAGAKPPRIVFERDEIIRMTERSMRNFRVELIKPFRWIDLMDARTTGGDWPWYLPPEETIALYYVVAKKT